MFELTQSLGSAHEKHLNKLLLFVERFEQMTTPIVLSHRRRVRPLFKRSTSTQLIKYRYNALCGNTNWIHVGHAARCVCVCICVCACLSEKCTTDITVRDEFNAAVLSGAYTLIVIFEKITAAAACILISFMDEIICNNDKRFTFNWIYNKIDYTSKLI